VGCPPAKAGAGGRPASGMRTGHRGRCTGRPSAALPRAALRKGDTIRTAPSKPAYIQSTWAHGAHRSKLERSVCAILATSVSDAPRSWAHGQDKRPRRVALNEPSARVRTVKSIISWVSDLYDRMMRADVDVGGSRGSADGVGAPGAAEGPFRGEGMVCSAYRG
jgi:hypothetical protein